MLAVGHAQFAGEADQPVGAHDRRIEAVEVDPRRNGLETIGDRGKALHGIARDMLGYRDHGIGAHLAAFEEAAHQVAGDERPVQRGDPLDVEPPGERAGDPGGGGRAGLHDVDPGIAQRACELGRQREPAPQSVAADRQLDVRGAQPQQVGHHSAARRGDEGRTARCDHGLRRVERGAGEAAAGEGGHDLKKRGRGHGVLFFVREKMETEQVTREGQRG